MSNSKDIAMEYSLDIVYSYIADYLCEGYNPDELFYIDFFDDPIIEVRSLEMCGYDLNDDGTVYRDEAGHPVNTTPNEHCHLVEDITMLDESGKRVPNEEYIYRLVRHYLD